MKKLNQKGFSAFEITLLVLVLAALGFAGYMVYQRNSEEKNSSQVTVTKKDKESEKEEAAPGPTKDWQTYTNAAGKYSVKFPKTWVTAANPEMCSEGLVLIGVKMTGDTSSVGKCAAGGARAFGQMAIAWRTDRADLSLCGFNTDGTWSVDSKESLTVAGVPAVKTSATYVADDEDMGGNAKGNKAVQYCFVAKNTQYIASYTKWSDYPDALNDFNTMVTKTFVLN